MTNIHFVILGVIAIINLANCSIMDLPCQKKSFRNYQIECATNNGVSIDIDVCMYTTSGVISKDGRVNVERFKEINRNFVLHGRETVADDYIEALHRCAKKVGSGKSPKEALRDLEKCEKQSKMEELLKKAVC